jgi:L-alanine-DL-glutamate epimerase-like enolase superfamily enzyme
VSRIAAAATWECELPLEHPIHLGYRIIRSRAYQLLTVSLDSGATGTAIGYTRGLPLTQLVGVAMPWYLEQDVDDLPLLTRRFWSAHSQIEPALVRGMSLIDVALWNARAAEDGTRLGALLGSASIRPPVLAVCGYHAERRTREDLLDEVLAAREAGHRAVKIIAPTLEASGLAEWLSVVREAVPELAVSVDLYNGFADADAGRATLAAIDDLGLDFIEDPFRPGRWRDYADVTGDAKTPYAAGEDVVGLRDWRDLIELGGIQVVRVDATASGGVSSVLDIIELARGAGVRVFPHVFHELHAEFAASGAVDLVESIAPTAGVEPLSILGPASAHLDKDGRLVSGSGAVWADLDWQAVERYEVTKGTWR